MPALAMSARRLPGRGARVAGIGLLAAILLTLELGVSDPVAARDWSPYIASLRNSQLYYESAMRAADLRIRATKHGIRRARRTLARARRAVDQKRDRLEREKDQLGAARAAWSAARAELEEATVAPPVLQELSAALRWATVPPLPPLAETTPVTTTSSLVLVALDSEQLATEAHAYIDEVLAARELVAGHAREVHRQERTVARARHRLAGSSRNQRLRIRHVGALRRAQRAAIARREGAEAGLGNAILGMSRYAQRRVAKQTNVRPGVTSSFIWPTRGRLTQGFSGRHDGLDIASYQGTPIRAAAVGVISYVGWNPWDQEGRAFMVVVAHPGGFETLYGHTLPTRAVRVGDVVKKGELIGYMGSTGNSTGSHLHFEMRRGRRILNPLAYM